MTRVVCLLATLLALLGAMPALAEKTDAEKKSQAQEKRAEIDAVAKEQLDRLFSESPKAKELFDKAHGWAVFDNRKLAIGITGGESGKGVAVEKASGKRAYMKMRSVTVGLGLGGQSYDVIFLFQDAKTFRHFVDKGWTASSSASAVAGGEGAGAALSFVNGMAVFVLTDKGLMARADIGGTKYWKPKKLNE